MRSGCIAGKVPGFLAAWLVAGLVMPTTGLAAQPTVKVVPERVELAGNFARAQLLVAQPNAEGAITERSDDLTAQGTFSSSDPSVVTVNSAGQLLAITNGEAKI